MIPLVQTNRHVLTYHSTRRAPANFLQTNSDESVHSVFFLQILPDVAAFYDFFLQKNGDEAVTNGDLV